MRTKSLKRRVSNVLLIGILLAIVVGIYFNIYNSKAESVLEAAAVSIDRYGYLEDEEFKLEANLTENDVYEIELPQAINTKYVYQIHQVVLEDAVLAEGQTEPETEIIEAVDNKITLTREQVENKKINFEVTYDIKLLTLKDEGTYDKQLLTEKTEEEIQNLELTEQTQLLYGKVLEYEDEENLKLVKVSGYFPVDAEAQITPTTQEETAEDGTITEKLAYDVKIVIPTEKEDGTVEYQEVNIEQYGEQYQLTISDITLEQNIQLLTLEEDTTTQDTSTDGGISLYATTYEWDISLNGDGSVMATLDDSGTLTISGAGDWKNENYTANVPWLLNGQHSNITKIIIEEDVDHAYWVYFLMCNWVTSIEVSEENAYYKSVEGVLYSKSGETLMKYPGGKSETTYTIPEGVTSIWDYAIQGGSNLTRLEIPNSVSSILDTSIHECEILTSIEVSEENEHYKSIDGVLYSKDEKEIIKYPAGKTQTTYTILEGVTRISGYAFEWSDSLTSIEIPNGVTTIGWGAFEGCSSLTNIEIPNTVTSIGSAAFYECSSIPSITIPSGVTSIENLTFYFCSSLTNIEIPNTVTSIGDSAFQFCTSLPNINIPNSVSSVHPEAFFGCGSLTSIEVSEENAYYKSVDGMLLSKDGTVLVEYPEGKEEASYVIPEGITSIGECALDSIGALRRLVIPSTVTSIHPDSFWSSTTNREANPLNYIIVCKSGSTAETYAIDNEIDYAIDEEGPEAKAEKTATNTFKITAIDMPEEAEGEVKNAEVNEETLKYYWGSVADETVTEAFMEANGTSFKSGDTVQLNCASAEGYKLWVMAEDYLGNTKISKAVATLRISVKIDGVIYWGDESLDGSNYEKAVEYANRVQYKLKITNPDGVVEKDEWITLPYIEAHAIGSSYDSYQIRVDGVEFEDDTSGILQTSASTRKVLYTMSFKVNNSAYGSVSTSELLVADIGYTTSGDTLTLTEEDVNGNARTVTVIPIEEEGYATLVEWSPSSMTSVSGATTVTANLSRVESVAPTLSSIAVTSPAAGTYKAGQEVTIVATYSENIYGNASKATITSSTAPILKIKFGSGTERTTTFKEVSGNKITYTYTIVSGDNGTIATTAYSGTVYDEVGNSSSLSNKANTGNVVIADTAAPTLSSIGVTSPAAGAYKAGQAVTIVATYSENIYANASKAAITSSTAPTLKIKFGSGTERTTTFSSISGNKITYTYTIVTGDNGTIATTAYSGTVYDAIGNSSTVSNKDNSGNAILADTTAPTISSVTKNPDTVTNGSVTLTVNATDSESGIASSGYSFNGGTTWQASNQFTYTANTSNIVIKVRDAVGNISEVTSEVNNIDKTAPTLSSIAVVLPASGTYGVGQTITIVATYSENIYGNASKATITSTTAPVLKIKFGDGTERTATFKEVSGATITYRYTITSGDNGTLSTTAYSGTVYDEAGSSLSVSNKTNSGKTIVADTTAPTLSSIAVTSPAAGAYKAGQEVTIVATYSEAIYSNESGTDEPIVSVPTLKIKFGDGTERTAYFQQKTGNKITYTYTIASGDNGTLATTAYTGTVYDGVGNSLEVSNKAISGKVIVADTIAPTLSSIAVTSPVAGTYKAGQTVTIVATYSENIYGNESKAAITSSTAPILKIKFGNSEERTATFSSVSANTITYTYTITSGDNGTLATTGYNGIVYDHVGNSSTLSHKAISGNTIVAKTYGTICTITADKPSPTTASSITYTFTFSEEVIGFDKNDITITNGTASTFTTVTEGKVYTLVVTNTGSCTQTVSIAENVCTDSVGNGNEEASLSIVIDRTAPTLSSIAVTNPATGYYKVGEVVTIVATYSEAIYGNASKATITSTTAPVLKIKFGDGTERTATFKEVSENKITYTYTIASGDNGTLATTAYSGTVYDQVGNSLAVSNKTNSGNTIVADTIAPTLSSVVVTSPASGTYKAGQEVTIVATYSENIYGGAKQAAMTSTTAPVLKIKFGNSTERTATFNKVSGNTVTYTYTIATGDNGTLAATGFSGTVYDIAANTLTLTNQTLGGNTIEADTNAPQLISLSVTDPVTGTYKAGQVVTIVATYNENIYGTTSKATITSSTAPILKIKFGDGTERTATFKETSGATITYTYTIATGDNGKLATTSYTGTVYDHVGNTLSLSNKTLGGNVIIADTAAPAITLGAQSNTTWAETHSVEVTITDAYAGLVTGATLKYGWSTSNKTEPSTYTEVTPSYSAGATSATFTATGSEISGKYYLWVVPLNSTVKDTLGHTQTSTVKSTGTFYFDNTTPTITFDKEGNTTWAQSHSVEVTLNDEHSGFVTGATLKYGWSTSNTTGPESYITVNPTYSEGATSATFTATGSGLTGKYYLWVVPLNNTVKDILGHEQTETKISTGTFYFDNIIPTISVGDGNSAWVKSENITVTIEDLDSGLATGAILKYGWSTSQTEGPESYITASLATYSAGSTNTTFIASATGLSGEFYLWVVPQNNTVKDMAGNTQNTAVIVGPVKFDNTAPTVEFDPNGNSTWESKLTTTVTINEDGCGINKEAIKYVWRKAGETKPTVDQITETMEFDTTSEVLDETGTAILQIKSPITNSVDTGEWVLWVYLEDNLGNNDIVSSNKFYMDNEAPIITFNPEFNTTWAQSHSVEVTITDEISGLASGMRINYGWSRSKTTRPSSTNTTLVTPTYSEGDKSVTFTAVGTYEDTSDNIIAEYLTGKYYLWIMPVSDTLKDTLGNVQTEKGISPETYYFDNKAPDMYNGDAYSTNSWARSYSHTVIIRDYHMENLVNRVDDSGLAEGIRVKYGWSTSRNETPPESYTEATIKEYSAGDAQTTFEAIGSGYTGEYYLWIESIGTFKDIVGNEAARQYSGLGGVFKYDNVKPVVTIVTNEPTTGTRYVKGGTPITVSAADAHAGLIENAEIQYQWVLEGKSPSSSGWTTLASTNEAGASSTVWTVPASASENLNGIYQLYIKAGSVKDNVRDSTKNTNDQVVSGLFYFDNSSPNVTLSPNTRTTWSRSGAAVTVKISDSYAGLNKDISIQYKWVKDDGTEVSDWQTLTGTNDVGAESTTRTVPASATEGLTGTYYLHVKAVDIGDYVITTTGTETDNLLNEEKQTELFLFDNTKPTVSFSPTSSTVYSKSGAKVEITLADAHAGLDENVSIQYKWIKDDGTEVSDWQTITGTNAAGVASTTRTVPASASAGLTGKYYLHIKSGTVGDNVTNDTKNTNAAGKSGVFYFDNTGTIITFNTEKQEEWTKGTAVKVTGTDKNSGLEANAKIQYQWVEEGASPTDSAWVELTASNSAGATSTSWTVPKSASSTLTSEKYYYLYIREGILKDNVSETEQANANERTISGGFHFDATKPTISFNPNTQTSYSKGTPQVVITIADAHAGLSENVSIQYQWATSSSALSDSGWKTVTGTNTAGASSTTRTVPANASAGFTGNYYLFIKAGSVVDNTTDSTTTNANNQAQSAVFKFDNTKPTITFNPNTQTSYSKGTPKVVVTISDSPAGLAQNVSIQYQWATSSSALSDSGWKAVTGTNTAGASSTTRTIPADSSAGFNGDYYLFVKEGSVRDNVTDSTTQNTNAQTQSAVFKFDNIAPVISVLNPNSQTDSWTRGTAVTVTATDSLEGLVASAQIQYQWVSTNASGTTGSASSSGWTTLTASNSAGASSVTWTVPKDASSTLTGYYKLYIKAGVTGDNVTEATKNTNAEKVSEVFQFDNSGPKISFNVSTKTSWVKGGQPITVTGSDSQAGLTASAKIQYQWVADGGAPSSSAWTELTASNSAGASSTTWTVPASASSSLSGVYKLYIREGITKDNITDSTKNTNAEAVTGTFNFDNTKPSNAATATIKLGNSSGEEYVQGRWTNSSVYIALNNDATDAHSGVEKSTYSITKNGVDYLSNQSQSTSNTLTDTGIYVVTITTEDNAVNSSGGGTGNTTTRTYTIKIDKVKPVITSVSPESHTGSWIRGTEVTVTATDANAGLVGNAKLQYQWVKDGNEPSTGWTTISASNSAGASEVTWTIPKPETISGIYNLYINDGIIQDYVMDDTKNTAEGTNAGPFYFDNEKPKITFSINLEDVWIRGNRPIVVTASDSYAGLIANAQMQYQWVLDGQSPASNGWTSLTASNAAGVNSVSWSVEVLEGDNLNGSYYLYVREGITKDNVIDSTKNSNAETTAGIFKFDNTAPNPATMTIKLGSSSGTDYVQGNWTNSNVYISLNDDATDTHSGVKKSTYTVKKDGETYTVTDNLLTEAGIYTITVTTEDNAVLTTGEKSGNRATRSYTVKIDRDNPIITSISPNEQTDSWTKGTAVTVTAQDVTAGLVAKAKLQYQWVADGGTPSASGWTEISSSNSAGATTATWTVPKSASSSLSGKYQLYIKEGIIQDNVMDTTKNTNVGTTASGIFQFDSEKPKITFNVSSKTAWVKGGQPITVTATDNYSGLSASAKIQYQWVADGGSTASDGWTTLTASNSVGASSTTWTVPASASSTLSGVYRLYIRGGTITDNITDSTKNSNSETATGTFNFDNTIPSKAATMSFKLGSSTGETYEAGKWTNQSVYISLNNDATDAHSGVKESTYVVSKDGKTYTVTDNLLTETGTYTITITTKDKAVNSSGSSSPNSTARTYTVKIDKQDPTVGSLTMKYGSSSGSDYTNDTWTNQSVYIAVKNGSDEHSGHKTTTYSINGGAAKTAATTLTETGTYEIVVTTTDNVGNTSTMTGYTVKIDKKEPTPGTMIMKLENSNGSDYTNDTWTAKSVYLAVKDGSDEHSGHKSTVFSVNGGATRSDAITLTETGTHTIVVTTTDNVGNTSTRSYTVKIDKVAPVVGTMTMKLESSSGSAYSNDTWTNKSVYIAVNNGSDAHSGHKTTTYSVNGGAATSEPQVLNPGDGKSATYTIVVTTIDNVDNTSTSSTYTVKIDKIDPTVGTMTMKLESSSGSDYSNNTWTNKSVYIAVNNGSDAESGHKTTTYSVNGGAATSGAQVLNPGDGKSATYTIVVTTTDNALNTSTKTYTVKIDKIAPVVGTMTMSLDTSSGKTYENDTWTKHSVYIAVNNGSDEESGHKTTTYSVNGGTATTEPQTLTETGTYTIVVKTTDNASNTSTKTYTVKIDKVAPVVGTLSMKLGNSSGEAYENGTWTGQSVYLSKVNGTDKNSGHLQTYFDVKLEDGTTYLSKKTSATLNPGDGKVATYIITVTTEDKAGEAYGEEGNIITSETYTVKIDKKDPTAGTMIMKLENSTGSDYTNDTWTAKSVYLAVKDGSDEHSGHKSTVYSIDGGTATTEATTLTETGTYEIVVTTTDNVGNTSTRSYTVKIDKVAPSAGTMTMKLESSSGSDYSNNTWTNKNVYIAVNNGSDAHSGHKTTTYSVNGGAATSEAQILNPGDGKSATYTIVVTTKDNVNNTTTRTGYTVKIDKVAPTVGTMTMKLESSSGSDYTNDTWTNQSVYIAVNNGSDAESGHKSTVYTVNGGTATTAAQTLTDTGTYTIVVKTTDNASNISTKTYTVKIDKIEPVPGTMTMKLDTSSGSSYEKDTWTKHSVYLAVNNGSDAHSGHKTTTYSVNGGDAKTSATTLTETGTYTIVVTTTDKVDNTATSETYTVKIDKEAPKLAEAPLTMKLGSSSGNAYENDTWTNQSVYLEAVNGTDEHSGHLQTYFDVTLEDGTAYLSGKTSATLDPGAGKVATYKVTVTTEDKAGESYDEEGNRVTSKTYTVKIDRINPTIGILTMTEVDDDGNIIGEYPDNVPTKNLVTLELAEGSDNESGHLKTYYDVTLNGKAYLTAQTGVNTLAEEGQFKITVTTQDVAGNIVTKNYTVIIDLTKPDVVITGEATVVQDGLIRYYNASNNTGAGHDGAATTWKDLSGNYDGTLVGSPSFSNEYISFSGSNWVNLGQVTMDDTITIEASFKLDTVHTSGERMIVTNAQNGGVVLRTNNGMLSFGGYVKGGYRFVTLSEVLDTNRIYNVAGTYDGTNFKLYVDGVLQVTYKYAGTISAPTNDTVMAIATNPMGSNGGGNSGIKGDVYSVRIYDRTLTEAEVKQNFNADRIINSKQEDADLIRHFDAVNNLGDGHSDTTTTWKDLSGNNDGLVKGGATFTSEYLELDGVNDWVNAGTVTAGDNITLETTVMFNTIPESGEIIVMGNYETGRSRA